MAIFVRTNDEASLPSLWFFSQKGKNEKRKKEKKGIELLT